MDKEFDEIVKDIINNEVFLDLKNYKHHGITRYEHCLRVGKMTYRIAKKHKLRYIEATRAAVLHDCFFIRYQEINIINKIKTIIIHPRLVINEQSERFNINKFEQKMILSHMFPVGIHIPLSFEAWVLNYVDHVASIYERLILPFKKKMN